MSQPFRAKLDFVLKALSISRAQLAAALDVDKSVVGRWLRGEAKPSHDNLARLTSLIAERVASFSILDWERDLAGLARALGVDPQTAGEATALRLAEGPYSELLDQILATTRRRGAAYEGFYLSRDIGPAALALGGDWLLQLPLARSLSQGLLAK